MPKNRSTQNVNASMFGFDTAHNHFNKDESVLTVSNVKRLQPYHVFSTNGSIYSSPAVVDGVAYIGSKDQHLYAFRVRNGGKLWDVATTGEIYGSPTVIDDTVYITSGNRLSVYDSKKGMLLWLGEMPDAIFSSPAEALCLCDYDRSRTLVCYHG